MAFPNPKPRKEQHRKKDIPNADAAMMSLHDLSIHDF
jgi:hypothetical protein